MGLGGSGGGTTTRQVDTGPWEAQKPYLTFGFDQARQLYDSGEPAYYPGDTLAPFAAETDQALTRQAERARAGSPLLPAADATLQGTLDGDMLSAGNPYFHGVMDRVAHEVVPRVAGQFEGSGRYGSGLHAATTAQALADTGAQYAYQNYGDERARQMQAAGLAPTLAAADYADIGALAAAGTARQQQAQAERDADVKRWDFEQNAGWNDLARYMGMVNGSYGQSGTTTETSTSTANPFLQGLGMVSSLVNIGNQLYGSGGLLAAAPTAASAAAIVP